MALTKQQARACVDAGLVAVKTLYPDAHIAIHEVPQILEALIAAATVSALHGSEMEDPCESAEDIWTPGPESRLR